TWLELEIICIGHVLFGAFGARWYCGFLVLCMAHHVHGLNRPFTMFMYVHVRTCVVRCFKQARYPGESSKERATSWYDRSWGVEKPIPRRARVYIRVLPGT
ncbi:hypothetical protein J3E72DRAFT_349953, partial [Bipolaris maydis]